VDRNSRLERQIKLRDLRVLSAVARAGSMSKAATELATSQPAISRSIAELERIVGVPLFDRSPRGIALTLFGRALMARSTTIFDELKLSSQDIESLCDPSAGEVRIGAPLIVSVGLVAAVIKRLRQRYPRLSFHVLGFDTESAMHVLEERKVDLAIAHLMNPIEHPHLNIEVLFEEPHIVAAGPDSHWLRIRRPKLADLVEEPGCFRQRTAHSAL
jgi:DNA-binding transcriptional LysR family regulator